MTFDLQGKKVWVAGHRGMLGSALVRRLSREDCEILTVDRAQLDQRDGAAVLRWVQSTRPDAVIIASAKAGGIMAHRMQPVEFLLDNLQIGTAILAAAHACDVDRAVFISSSAVYPAQTAMPIHESALLTGPFDPSHHGYAIAKIAGMALAQAYSRQYGRAYISALPTNLYGPGDKYDATTSHVVPAIIRKVHEASQIGEPVVVWGSGRPRRELLHVDDCADACVHLLQHHAGDEHVNVGYGSDVSIIDLTLMVMETISYHGKILHDLDKPDGTMQKLMSSDRLRALGWIPRIDLRTGLAGTYADFLERFALD
ncbi:NAD-dependent epimerase/dehydratase family protein [Novosphingobium sp. FSY-8]|uniref:GDP-L-fucose synthase n=1 Tax=Novosphingobium ovatum TaxID=1908523 RepID=A0ABW9XGP7_9SPHN|nr:GDP-L-fucose synthase [Novosphingobium ovatum]NBC37639.1 NAD-dependent epimerase/dehydratase family protein [Novosphingobium ovatum]